MLRYLTALVAVVLDIELFSAPALARNDRARPRNDYPRR